LPILSLITFLVILVVKTSLALSLCLVGALSIIRFRTPIKEPEELIYLFLSIGLGLGYGANQTLITISIFTGILIVISFSNFYNNRISIKKSLGYSILEVKITSLNNSIIYDYLNKLNIYPKRFSKYI
tara:strand:+ start:450 stop:833 length:384 start_codon:yes stop_codon:yes gene_type:complete